MLQVGRILCSNPANEEAKSAELKYDPINRKKKRSRRFKGSKEYNKRIKRATQKRERGESLLEQHSKENVLRSLKFSCENEKERKEDKEEKPEEE